MDYINKIKKLEKKVLDLEEERNNQALDYNVTIMQLKEQNEILLERLGFPKDLRILRLDTSKIRTCVHGCGKFDDLMKHYKGKHIKELKKISKKNCEEDKKSEQKADELVEESKNINKKIQEML